MRLVVAVSLLAFLFGIAPCAPAHAEPTQASPAARTVRLTNGLRVVLAPRRAAADVSVAVVYDVGRRDVPSGLEGLSGLTATLLVDGTKHLPRDAGAPMLEAAGAIAHGFLTTVERTEFFETVPPGALDLALWIEAERMAFPLDGIDAARFQDVKRAWTEAQRQGMHLPLASLDRFTADALWPTWHPFHDAPRATDGAAVTLDDARALVSTWYAPRNATIAIAGNFDPDRAAASVERFFARIPDRSVPARPRLPRHDSPQVARTYLGAANALPTVRLAWTTPALGAPGDAELDFIAAIVTRHLKLVLVDPGDLRAVSASQNSLSEPESSTFTIDIKGQPRERPEDILVVVDQELAKVSLDAEALARVRAVWQTREMLGLESTLGQANLFAAHPDDAARRSFPLDQTHANVTPSSLRETMAAWLSPKRRAEILVRKLYDQPIEGAEVGPLKGEPRPGDRR